MNERAFPRGAPAYAIGVALLLVGDVLPWYRQGGVSIWGWDISALWTVAGRSSLLRTPPAAGTVVLLSGLLLAEPVLRRRRLRNPAVAAGLAGLVIGVTGLAIVRALTLVHPVSPFAGLVMAVAGGILVAIGALLQAG